MDPLTLGMLALSAGQMVHNVGKEERDRKLLAATQRYSPWTKLTGEGSVKDANAFGQGAQSLMGAAGYEQQKKTAAANDALTEAQANMFKSWTAPSATTVGPGAAPPTAIGNPYGRIRGSNYQVVNPAMGTGSSQPLGALDGPWGMPQNIG